MTVFLVGAGPGDPGLFTRRGAEVLVRADVVVYDRLVDRALLALAPPGAELVDAGALRGTGRPSDGDNAQPQDDIGQPQDEIDRLLVERGRSGATVVRLKGGDPYLFGHGAEEAQALRAAGVDYEVVPGVTSAFAVPTAAGIPVTRRGTSTSVTVVTGRVGDPGASGGPDVAPPDWEALGRAGGTLVVLMGMATRAEIARRLLGAGRAPGTPVAVVERGTTHAQRVVRTTLDRLAGVELGSPAVIVIGEVAGLDLSPLAGAPLAGTTVVVTRPRDGGTALTGALGAAGARVVHLSVVDVADPEDGGAALEEAAGHLSRYRWVAFTSANAVRRLLTLVPDVRVLAGVRLAAVGPGTAAALVAHRLVPDLVASRASAAGLGDEFPVADAPGGSVLFPASAGARPTLPAALRAKRWDVDEVVAYRTVPAPPPPGEVVSELGAAWAVVFASPSAVEAYVSMRTVGETSAGEPLPVPPVVACIGSVTADAARAAGLEVAIVAPSPSADALVDALAAVRSQERSERTPAGGPRVAPR